MTNKPIRLEVGNKEEKEYLISLLNKEKIPYRLINGKFANKVSGPDIEYEWKCYEKVAELKREAGLWIKQQQSEN
ncbi:MAG: hypothetical protein JRJ39_11580 [Deltaproteobacteria bacterium]|nr:hypothetical protein [Deltaproteobacteria bacterium]MBW1814276.1 hypothetical protein [Deltaproteobacteria bacterium]MBW1846369.1 hypothetical protein [Deltaproteobacteria bacterium]MBW2179932.1 hypothetical protein [Deltaproteobacteria bacterium]MBW2364234.1 hypothetical protein [Deltaproteobacteria bacterium]